MLTQFERSSLDGTSRLWNSSTGECLRVFNDHTSSIYTIAFSPDSRLFATAGADGYLHVYDMKVSLDSPCTMPSTYSRCLVARTEVVVACDCRASGYF